jgi:hypothetical protein
LVSLLSHGQAYDIPEDLMDERDDQQAGRYPRQDLTLRCSRRTFFRALFQEAVVINDALKGKPGFRITELGQLPDDLLAGITPLRNPDREIYLEGGHVWARTKSKATAPVKLFATKERSKLSCFNLITGEHTLGEIAQRLAEEMDWDEPAAFAHLRDLFLTLAAHAVCLPKDPLE